MTQRLDYRQQSPDLVKKLTELSFAQHKAHIERKLLDLVNIRASQLNGCAFCLDMHVKEATMHGERALRLHHIAIWRESPLFDARERAVLEWTEAVTHLSAHGVGEDIYALARQHFSEQELSDLTFAVATINAWNRISIAFQVVPGSMDALYGLDKAQLA
jgi:AhpD family alkylhydroperoxidase